MDTTEQLANEAQQQVLRLRSRLEKIRYELDALERDLAETVKSMPVTRKTLARDRWERPKPSKG